MAPTASTGSVRSPRRTPVIGMAAVGKIPLTQPAVDPLGSRPRHAGADVSGPGASTAPSLLRADANSQPTSVPVEFGRRTSSFVVRSLRGEHVPGHFHQCRSDSTAFHPNPCDETPFRYHLGTLHASLCDFPERLMAAWVVNDRQASGMRRTHGRYVRGTGSEQLRELVLDWGSEFVDLQRVATSRGGQESSWLLTPLLSTPMPPC